MGVFNDLIKMMLRDNNIDDEKTLKAIDAKGDKDSESIAKRLAPKDKTAFVPKVDVPPVELPEKVDKDVENQRDEK